MKKNRCILEKQEYLVILVLLVKIEMKNHNIKYAVLIELL